GMSTWTPDLVNTLTVVLTMLVPAALTTRVVAAFSEVVLGTSRRAAVARASRRDHRPRRAAGAARRFTISPLPFAIFLPPRAGRLGASQPVHGRLADRGARRR